MNENGLESRSADRAQPRGEQDAVTGSAAATSESTPAAGTATGDTPGGPEEPAVPTLSGSIATPDRTESEPSVMVGIPAYNEAGSIADVVTAATPHAAVVVVDDGSDDETAERARAAGATVVSHDDNQGYGATLATIFRHAHAARVDHLVILDGDGQHDPEDVPKMVAAQRASGADIVVGSRFVSGSNTRLPLYRRLGLAVVNTLTNAGMRLRYATTTAADTQSGFRAYDRDAIETVVRSDDLDTGMGASLDLLFLAAREGLEVTEVPTTVTYDVNHASSEHPATHGLTLLGTIAQEVVPGRAVRTGAAIAVALATLVAAVGMFRLFDGAITRTLGVLLIGVMAAIGLAYPRATRGLFTFVGR